jgi:CRISPR-associated protein Cas1
LKWDTVIQQKTIELSRYLTGRTRSLSFSEPSPVLSRADSEKLRRRILSLSQSNAQSLGIGKSTLHYLRRNVSSQSAFRTYHKVLTKLHKTGIE